MNATRERRLPCGGSPASALCDPRRYRVDIGPGLTAQCRGLAHQGLIKLALAGALEKASHLSEQVDAAARELGQRGDRRGLLVAGELAPLSAMPRLAGELGYEDTVSLRTIIEHEF